MADKAEELLSMMTDEKMELTEDEKKLIDLVNQGMTQEEIGKQFKKSKHTICRNIKSLNDKYPDLKLETIGMKKKSAPQEEAPVEQSQEAPQKPTEATKTEQAIISPQTEKQAENGANTKQKNTEKRVYSFRAEVSDIAKWGIYAATKGMKKEEMGVLAMNEYIANHELTDEEKNKINGM